MRLMATTNLLVSLTIISYIMKIRAFQTTAVPTITPLPPLPLPPPTDLFVLEVNSSAVLLEWSKVIQSSGVSVTYIVEYKEPHTQHDWRTFAKDIRGNRYTVHDLMADKEYMFAVRSATDTNIRSNRTKISNPVRTLKTNKHDNGEFLGIGQGHPKTLNAGDTLTLQCFLRLGLSDPNSIRWFKDGVELNDSSSDSRMAISRINRNDSVVLGKGVQQEITLRIARLTVADSGRYMCRASEEKNKTVTIYIKAITPPQLSWRSESTRPMSDGITVREGQDSSVQLRCQLLQGNPKPRFSWFKDNNPIHPKENWLKSPSCAHLKEGIYFFTNDSKQDVIICGSPIKYEKFSGRYTCRAANEKGSDEIHVDLNILAAAKIQEPKMNIRLVVHLDKAVHQTCRARGNPPPKVEWRKIQDKDSVLMSHGFGNETVSLSLHSVSENDAGNYSCIAQNGHTDQLFVQIMLDYQPVVEGPDTGISNAVVGTVIGCVAAALLIALVASYVGTRRHTRIKKQYLITQNVTLRYEPPLQAKELSRGASSDMIVVCSQPETDFTPSYCDAFQEEDATTREIAEFLSRKKETKARTSILGPVA